MPLRRFGILCVLAYVALSWMARFDMRLGSQIRSLVYPLDTFSMYSPMASALGTRLLLVRDAHGAVHSVEDYRAFDCEGAVDAEAACHIGLGIQYHYEDLTRYIASHVGTGEEPVDLILRSWRLQAGEPPVRLPDCVITRCRVMR